MSGKPGKVVLYRPPNPRTVRSGGVQVTAPGGQPAYLASGVTRQEFGSDVLPVLTQQLPADLRETTLRPSLDSLPATDVAFGGQGGSGFGQVDREAAAGWHLPNARQLAELALRFVADYRDHRVIIFAISSLRSRRAAERDQKLEIAEEGSRIRHQIGCTWLGD